MLVGMKSRIPHYKILTRGSFYLQILKIVGALHLSIFSQVFAFLRMALLQIKGPSMWKPLQGKVRCKNENKTRYFRIFPRAEQVRPRGKSKQDHCTCFNLRCGFTAI